MPNLKMFATPEISETYTAPSGNKSLSLNTTNGRGSVSVHIHHDDEVTGWRFPKSDTTEAFASVRVTNLAEHADVTLFLSLSNIDAARQIRAELTKAIRHLEKAAKAER